MSINIFLSDKLPKEKNKLISIISFNENLEYTNNILSVGMPEVSGKKLYEIWEVEDKVTRNTYNNINISSLPTGFYIVKIENINMRFIKE